MDPSFPPPEQPMNPPTINPRPQLAPLGVAPSMAPFDPSAIPPPNLRAFKKCKTHSVSLHFAPAAFPRCASTPGTIKVPANLPPEERKQRVKEEAFRLIKEKRALEKDLVRGRGFIEASPERVVSPTGLWNAVLRIERKESLPKGVEGVTLIVTHANGFHKETWEVPFRRLIDLTETPNSSIRILNIWILECVGHGDSALANGDNIPRLADRSDYGRDIANFCLHYLPPCGTAALPTILQRCNGERAERKRRLVGIGHSLGGDAMAHCALNYPDIFQSVVLSETTLFPAHLNSDQSALSYVGGALGRRGEWPSREEALQALLKAPMYAALHPGVLQSYIDHALYEVDGRVKLKCRPEWEARQFNELLSMNEAWERLPTMDGKIWLHWIMGGLESASAIVGGSIVAQNTVWRKSKNSSNTRIPASGHLVMQEKPFEYAQALADFLQWHVGGTKMVKAQL